MLLRAFALPDQESVIALWERCGLTRAWNDPRKDIDRKMKVQPELFLVAVDGDEIVGSVMAGYDGHRGWLYYLAADPARQRQGIGRALVEEAERLLTAMGCPKVNLMFRRENSGVAGFYAALGYLPDDVASLGKRLIPDLPRSSSEASEPAPETPTAPQ